MPANAACVPAGDATGMFVKDTATNNIYFSQAGYDRAINGADTYWAGVAGDLLRIAGQSAGAVGLGVIGILAYFADLSGWIIHYLSGDDPE